MAIIRGRIKTALLSFCLKSTRQPSIVTDTFLILAGVLAGAMNALAGGGSYVTLPALIAVGVPSVAANSTSTLALYPGGLASSWVYRDGLAPVCGIPVILIAPSTLVGGFVGSFLLLITPSSVFDAILPWLLLVATIMLAGGKRVGPFLRKRFHASALTVVPIQFLLGIYDGYFGGAVGLMMIAVWSVLDGADFKPLSPMSSLMVSAANLVVERLQFPWKSTGISVTLVPHGNSAIFVVFRQPSFSPNETLATPLAET